MYTDDEVRATIRRVYEERGYLLDPHSAIGYLGLTGVDSSSWPTPDRRSDVSRSAPAGNSPSRIFLATAHPAKFREVVEPLIGRPIDIPAPLAAALAKPRCILRLDATLAALRERITAL